MKAAVHNGGAGHHPHLQQRHCVAMTTAAERHRNGACAAAAIAPVDDGRQAQTQEREGNDEPLARPHSHLQLAVNHLTLHGTICDLAPSGAQVAPVVQPFGCICDGAQLRVGTHDGKALLV